MSVYPISLEICNEVKIMPHEIPEYMSADYVKDKTSVDILWRQLATLQEIASEFSQTKHR